MTTKYNPPNFKVINQEICDALSTLKKHGINIEFNEGLKKRFDDLILFDGDDGLFKSLIKNIDTYFEYGCGKSTEYLYRYSNCDIYSVDTDQEWITRIQKLTNGKKDKRLNLDWVDVGNVGQWGYPVSYSKRNFFFNYANNFYKLDKKPDLVLIDGRFRVFCFLTTIKNAPIGTKIVFDDYTNRPLYHVVEEFSPVLDKCGRQALFEVNIDAKNLLNNEILISFQNILL